MIALLVLFFAYVGYVWARFGVLSSISASSYRLKGNEKAIFTAWLVLLATSTWWLHIGILGHLMAIGFCIAGMSTDHKKNPNSPEDEYHTGGTLLAMIAGFIAAGWIAAGVFLVGAIVLKLTTRNWIWWSEILAALVIAVGLEYRML